MARGDMKEPSSILDSAVIAGIVVFALAFIGLWFRGRPVIVWMTLGLDWIQLVIMHHLGLLHEGGEKALDFAQANFDGRFNPWNNRFSYLTGISSRVGSVARWGIAPAIIGMGVVVLFKMKGGGFRRRFILGGGKKSKGLSLIDYQSAQWRVTKPVVAFDPNTTGGREAPARTPFEWLRDHKIKITTDGLETTAAETRVETEKAEKAFIEQLGPAWGSYEKQPAHVRAIAMICALNAANDPKNNDLRGDVAALLSEARSKNGKYNLRALNSLLAPYEKREDLVRYVTKLGGKHYFASTALCRMVEDSRRRGSVLASVDLRWLKPIDRSLWYAMNNIGRRAFHIEAAGVMAHYFAEQAARYALHEPHVLEAVKGLGEYVHRMGIENVEALFRSREEEEHF